MAYHVITSNAQPPSFRVNQRQHVRGNTQRDNIGIIGVHRENRTMHHRSLTSTVIATLGGFAPTVKLGITNHNTLPTFIS